ncbi:MAG: peptidylprolyl isomerase [Chloroflexi bacterium]|nr:peptidylprolyl isomerase [Chloroflexota bacterium]
MQIAKHKVVTINYTLTDDEGKVIDSSKGGEPLAYIQGIGNLIPGLEAALEGRSSGDTLAVSISPEDGYGLRDEAMMQVVARDTFNSADELEIGMRFRAQLEGGTHVFTVVGVDGDEVTIDGNHPLAGMTLNFDVAVVDVREATAEELSHGHAHGPDGHGH